jgi:putative Holliday junction resolvase
MKIIGLDLGDQWTGVAISDSLGFFARPLQTVTTADLDPALAELIEKERVNTIIVGLPRTMKGTQSEQTNKVISHADQLKKKFPQITWIMWDERLSSKRAQAVKPSRTKEEKLQSHAIAAAFILQSYLDHLSVVKRQNSED